VSSMSYSSDFLNEIPMIITPTRGTVRQLLGVVKAEVVQAPPSTPGSASSDSFKSSMTAKPSIRSPLADSSFGPGDVLKEADEEQDINSRPDPFADKHSPTFFPSQPSPTISVAHTQASDGSAISDWSPEEPSLPWARRNDKSRPSSWSTQAGSIIADIGSATRVQVGLQQLSPVSGSDLSYTSTGNSKGLHRMTSGRLVSPTVAGSPGGDHEQQQEKASITTQRSDHRVSSGSVLSMASTKADSILESFPFVPPSPISDRPIRVAPRSPLAQQQYTNAVEEKQNSSPPVAMSNPSNKRALAMSVGSQISTLTAGLGSFPFQIDSQNVDSPATSSTTASGRQRASLDTLALTRDLSSYPLGFDKELHENYPVPPK
jgi:protein OPY2